MCHAYNGVEVKWGKVKEEVNEMKWCNVIFFASPIKFSWLNKQKKLAWKDPDALRSALLLLQARKELNFAAILQQQRRLLKVNYTGFSVEKLNTARIKRSDESAD